MEAARQQFEQSIVDIQGLTSIRDALREGAEADIFKKLRETLKFLKKDESMLDDILEQDRIRILEFIHGRGLKKKMYANQAKESLKLLLASDNWLEAACSGEDLSLQLQEFLAGDAALLAKLEATARPDVDFQVKLRDAPGSPDGEDTATPSSASAASDSSHSQAPAAPLQAAAPAEPAAVPEAAPAPVASVENAQKMVLKSLDMMWGLRWEFPSGNGIEFDSATEASKHMYDGLTMLAALTKRDDAAAQRVLVEYDTDWASVLRFLSTMYDAKNRKTLRPRITSIAEKLCKWAPAFRAAAELTPPPWTRPQQAETKTAQDRNPFRAAAVASAVTDASTGASAFSKKAIWPPAAPEASGPPRQRAIWPPAAPEGAALAAGRQPAAPWPPAAAAGGNPWPPSAKEVAPSAWSAPWPAEAASAPEAAGNTPLLDDETAWLRPARIPDWLQQADNKGRAEKQRSTSPAPPASSPPARATGSSASPPRPPPAECAASEAAEGVSAAVAAAIESGSVVRSPLRPSRTAMWTDEPEGASPGASGSSPGSAPAAAAAAAAEECLPPPTRTAMSPLPGVDAEASSSSGSPSSSSRSPPPAGAGPGAEARSPSPREVQLLHSLTRDEPVEVATPARGDTRDDFNVAKFMEQHGVYIIRNSTRKALVFHVEGTKIDFNLKPEMEHTLQTDRQTIVLGVKRKSMLGLWSKTALFKLHHSHFYSITFSKVGEAIECNAVA